MAAMTLPKNIAAAMEKVLGCGDKISSVLHDYSIARGGRAFNGFDAQIGIFDATVSTLRQVLELVKSEVNGKKVFSYKGLEYINTLTKEFASELIKIQPIFEDACMTRKLLDAKRKLEKKKAGKQKGKKLAAAVLVKPDVEDVVLDLDKEVFLEKIEHANWTLAKGPLSKCNLRLFDIQIHFLLVVQVVTLGSLSRDPPSGKADLKSIVTYHERIERTADLIYLRLASKYPDSDSDTVDSIYIRSSSGSDSDASTAASFRARRRRNNNRRRSITSPPPPPPASTGSLAPPPPPVTLLVPDPPVIDLAKPPAYSESRDGSETASTLLGEASSATAKEESTAKETYQDEKKQGKEEKTKEAEDVKEVEPIKPTVAEGRLFKTKSSGFGFKLRTIFRSNASLAQEMRSVLVDTEYQLSAWVIRNHDFRQVPHSAFHSLEATHMRTILSQLNNNDWYQIFTRLDYREHSSLDRVLHHSRPGPPHPPGHFEASPAGEIIVLKLVHEEKQAAWMALLREILRDHPAPRLGINSSDRILLAIVREKLINGKVPGPTRSGPPPPPPPPALPVIPLMRPPPSIQQQPQRSRVSDLKFPYYPTAPQPMGVQNRPPIIPMGPSRIGGPGGPPPFRGPYPLGPPVGPPPPASTINPNPQPLVKSDSVRIIDTTPLTEHDAIVALTTYNAYTFRITEPLNPNTCRSWARVAVTQESTETSALIARIAAFERDGGDIIETKLLLTEQQCSQVTRLMDDVKLGEGDNRFAWTLVEMTLYNQTGAIENFDELAGNLAGTATHMHLIVKRMPKVNCRPMEMYNHLMRLGPPPWNNAPRPMPPSPPVWVGGRNRNKRRGNVSSRSSGSSSGSESSSDSDLSSGYSSNQDFRMKLRRAKAKAYRRKVREIKKKEEKEKKKRIDDSDSEDEDEVKVVRGDVIEVKLDLKPGEDVVKALLEMWTPTAEEK